MAAMRYSGVMVASIALNLVLVVLFINSMNEASIQAPAIRQQAQTSFMGAARRMSQPQRASLSASAYPMKVLIAQNKGGGHGEIGFHLANRLADKGHQVTLLGDPATKTDALPFCMYGDLEYKGVKCVYGDVCDPATFSNLGEFDAVFDNISKNKKGCQLLADLASNWGVKNYGYVSSAGMYKPGNIFPMPETLPVKETAGQKEVEDYLDYKRLPWTSFRPQYIYGPLTNKRDYLDYFFDRVIRGAPVPVAGSGQQLITLTHADDVAGMLATVIDAGYNAHGQVFNCATDQLISVDNLIALCSKIAGVETPPIVHYDPKKVKLEKKAFPYRDSHFFVAPDKAKALLGFRCEYDLEQELTGYFQGYLSSGKHEKPMTFPIDEEILAQTGTFARSY
mmetsp:Transcript_2045/g.2926  ORF Transcript_2045/g.2926 Transcript_2045/m.2926 type:complete len:394 (-) Transcript_2045:83-1264(-)